MKKPIFLIISAFSLIGLSSCNKFDEFPVKDLCTISQQVCEHIDLLCYSVNASALTKQDSLDLLQSYNQINKILSKLKLHE